MSAFKIGDQANHFQQQVEVHPLLRRNVDEDGVATPRFRHQAAIAQLLLHAIRICIRLIDLVYRNNDRHICRLGVIDGFERLRHHTVIRCDHDYDEIRHLGSACTHAGKGFVTRRIQEDDLAAVCRRAFLAEANLVRTDVLRDSARFARGYVGFTNGIQQAMSYRDRRGP